jgi:hypothetical protein
MILQATLGFVSMFVFGGLEHVQAMVLPVRGPAIHSGQAPPLRVAYQVLRQIHTRMYMYVCARMHAHQCAYASIRS